MLYQDVNKRKSLKVFRECLYSYIKANALRYSDQRERVLKVLYKQSYPMTIDKILRILNNDNVKAASYPTVVRHINFFNRLGWLRVVDRPQKEYLLAEIPPQYEEGRYEVSDYGSL